MRSFVMPYATTKFAHFARKIGGLRRRLPRYLMPMPLTLNQRVLGSNPSASTISFQLVRLTRRSRSERLVRMRSDSKPALSSFKRSENLAIGRQHQTTLNITNQHRDLVPDLLRVRNGRVVRIVVHSRQKIRGLRYDHEC